MTKFYSQTKLFWQKCSKLCSLQTLQWWGAGKHGRHVAWCWAELAGPAWAQSRAWLRVIGQRAVNPVTAEAAETQWPLSGHCLRVWLALATADSLQHITSEQSTLQTVISAFFADFRSDFSALFAARVMFVTWEWWGAELASRVATSH